MAQTGKNRRFKINPLELVIFSVVSLMFMNSLYKLFYDWEGFRVANMQSLQGQAGRGIASQTKSIGRVDLDCKDQITIPAPAARIKIQGQLCDDLLKTENAVKKQDIHTEIVNLSNQAAAPLRVFTFPDDRGGYFYTNFIDLSPGTHELQVTYMYNKVPFFSQKVTLKLE